MFEISKWDVCSEGQVLCPYTFTCSVSKQQEEPRLTAKLERTLNALSLYGLTRMLRLLREESVTCSVVAQLGKCIVIKKKKLTKTKKPNVGGIISSLLGPS